METLTYQSSDWTTTNIIKSLQTSGFLVVSNPFSYMKGTLESVRDKLKSADLKTLPKYEEGRPSTANKPGEANERVTLRNMSGNWDCINTIRKRFIQVGCDILYAIEEWQALPPNTITQKHAKACNDLTFVKYYANAEGDIRLGSHCDFGTLTLVHVCDPIEEYQICINDEWQTIRHPSDDFIIVNCGDFLQWWTKNKLKSTPHRISNETKLQRHSLIMFMDIDHESKVHGITKQEWTTMRAQEAKDGLTYHEF